MTGKDVTSKGAKRVGGCHQIERDTSQGTRLALDWWGLHHYSQHWGQAHTDAGDRCTKVGSGSSQRSIGGMHAAGLTNHRIVCRRPPSSMWPVRGTPCQDHRTNRVTQDESWWLHWGPFGHGIPPQHVLGLKAQVLVKGFVRLRKLQVRSAKYRLSHNVIHPKIL